MGNTEDQLNELRTTVSLMSMNLDKAVRVMANLTDRVDGIEQRQAKLAIGDTPDNACGVGGNGTEELELWMDLAEMLGFVVPRVNGNYIVECFDTSISMLLFGPDAGDKHNKQTKAMLHGLACLECNGQITEEQLGFTWSFCDVGSGELDASDPHPVSHPAALIAMLNAYWGQS